MSECKICGRSLSKFEQYDPHVCNPPITKEQRMIVDKWVEISGPTIDRILAVYDAAMAWHKAKYGSAGDITEIVKYRESRLRDACRRAKEGR